MILFSSSVAMPLWSLSRYLWNASPIVFSLMISLCFLGCGGDAKSFSSAPAATTGPAAPILSWNPPSSDFTPPIKVLPSGLVGNVLDFGARCDGIANDRAAIQQALDSLVIVQFPAGRTCVVHASPFGFTFFGTPHRYALSIPSNRAIYLNSSTLKLGDGQNAHLFVNSDLSGQGNSNIAILGPGTFDLNKVNQTSPASGEQSGGFMDRVEDLTISDITFTHVREYALRHFRVNRGYYDNLICTDSDGSCFSFGIAGVGGPTNSYFGYIEANDAAGTASLGAVGNPFISFGSNNILKSFAGTGNRFGFKLQDGASHWTIGSIHIVGTKADRGVKIMGTRDSDQTHHIRIDKIVTSDNFYEGVYVWESDDIAIGTITSNRDAIGPATAVTLAPTANRVAVKSISVQGSGGGGISIEGTDVDIGQIYARNNGMQLKGQANVATFNAKRIRVGLLITVDDQSPSTVYYGFRIHGGTTDLAVDSFLPGRSFVAAPFVSEGSNIRIVDYADIIKTFPANDATPSVRDGMLFRTGNSKETTISDFDEGRVEQEITVLCGDSNTTLIDAAHLMLSAPMRCNPGSMMRLYFDGQLWMEIGRTSI